MNLPTPISSSLAAPVLSALFVFITMWGAANCGAQTLAATPPMGWNSWNHFGKAISADDVKKVADAMVANGMRDAGYVYVNVDDGWQGQRDKDRPIHGNERFPDMKALADYVHTRGLKFGIYSTPGPRSCAGFEGGAGHEEEDARSFAEWGVDFLKYDICSFRKVLTEQAHDDPAAARVLMQAAYGRMQKALATTGRPILFSGSQHGLSEVWKWGSEAGLQMWRTGDDIRDRYESVTEIGFAQAGLAPFAGPGHWNDPDMLEIGDKELSLDEARTQMSLWSLLAAPLIAGNDPAHTTAEMLAVMTNRVMTNREVLALDQDPAGRQGDRVWAEGPTEIWSRDLADGSKAIGIFNRNAGPTWVDFDLDRLGWSTVSRVRDLWQGKDLAPIYDSQKFLVPRHGVPASTAECRFLTLSHLTVTQKRDKERQCVIRSRKGCQKVGST